MRPLAIHNLAVSLLLVGTATATAQAPDIQEKIQAVLTLRRAGALVTVVSAENPTVIRVSLSGIKNADQLLDEVQVLSDLVTLELAGTDVTDKSLEKLSKLRKLRSLNLASTKVSDKGLNHLKEISNLVELSLYGTPVSDEGIGQLKDLTELQTLVLNESKVTSKGRDALRQALPNLTITGIK